MPSDQERSSPAEVAQRILDTDPCGDALAAITRVLTEWREATERAAKREARCPACGQRLTAVGYFPPPADWVVFECRCGKWESPIRRGVYVQLDALSALESSGEAK